METWIIALISAVSSIVVTIICASIWFGRNTVTKDDLVKSTAPLMTELREFRTEIDLHGRNVGEAITGIRGKITEVELYVRDTFVRRDSWHQAMNQMQERWAAADKAADERWVRLETKMDKLVERLIGDK